MNATPDSAAGLAPPTATLVRSVVLVETMLDSALQAQRIGALDSLLRQRPLVARWLLRRPLRLVGGMLGAPSAPEQLSQVAAQVLRWLVAQLRPDAQPDFDGIPEEAWLSLSGWRPVLAMAAYAGYVEVPDFPRRYRRRIDEAPLDNLCGLWDVGPSTVYRLLEKARQGMAAVLCEATVGVARSLSLRACVARAEHLRLALDEETARRDWHRAQAELAESRFDPASALWHRWQAADVAALCQTLRRYAVVLAAEAETDAVVERMAAANREARPMVDLWIARAALASSRNAPGRELRAYEQARQVAQAANDPLLLGIAYSALGKYFESRDADRAFACYQDSAEFLRDRDPQAGDEQVLEHFITTYARLAWLYLLRNDERSRLVLDRAEALRTNHQLPDGVLGMLEHVWGEYWHRAGDRTRSLEHRYRALNIYERIGDHRSVLTAWQNIGLDLASRGDHERAIAYLQRITDAARQGGVEPSLHAGAHLNIGASRYWRGELDAAIESYGVALSISLHTSLRLHAFRARYNLAEAHYSRFRDHGRAEDEAAGDTYVSEALAAPASDSNPAALESVRGLKAAILGESRSAEPNRLLPGDQAVYLQELSEVQRQREVLSLPGDPEAHAQAHLAIARAYLAISTKEREAALALIHKHDLQSQFAADFEDLKQTFNRELTREQQLADAWKQVAADIVDDPRRAPLIEHLVREGSINKSGYVDLCGVSPATASKHLGLLAERGLLVQTGKGPSTRYSLPA